MINIVLKLPFIYDMVDLFSNSLNSTIFSNLANDKLIISTLAKLELLIYRLSRISNDLFKLEWAKFCPFFFHSLKSSTRLFFTISIHGKPLTITTIAFRSIANLHILSLLNDGVWLFILLPIRAFLILSCATLLSNIWTIFSFIINIGTVLWDFRVLLIITILLPVPPIFRWGNIISRNVASSFLSHFSRCPSWRVRSLLILNDRVVLIRSI